MGARENLQRLLDKKQAEIDELERQIGSARSYLQGIQDAVRALPRDSSANGERSEEEALRLRPGTLLFRTQEMLQRHGSPMHIGDILKALGIENTKATRVSLVGSLGAYVRKGLVFSRPGPNVFGLLGMKEISKKDGLGEHEQSGVDLPIDFGK